MRYYPLLLLPGALAFNFPFNLFSSNPQAEAAHFTTPAPPRVAVIGAGAAGSSSAFWISKAKERYGLNVQVDVYESSDYIGGRSTVVYPYGDKTLPELELGASIFVPVNKNLWRASNEFNLTRRDFAEENYETAIWDGENVLLTFSGSWWDTAKMLWRYGYLSPRRTDAFVKKMVNDLLAVYTASTPKWASIESLAQILGWTNALNSTTAQALEQEGVSKEYIFQIVEAATRVNYGQNVDYIHAIEGGCSMAATGASGIAGGNFQIFEHFLNRSGASVYLNTPVLSLSDSKSSDGKTWTVKTKTTSKDYKAIIIAAPFHSTGITTPPHISEQIPDQPYVNLHVTLLSTRSERPNPGYFGLLPSSPAPRVILTTDHRGGGKRPEFNSLSYHGVVREGEWAVKIFSDHEITDEWLNNMFFGEVGWVHRKQWKAYPKLPPTVTYPPVKLDQGLYYVNAFEPFISTMETETVSSRNVVDLLLNDEFSSGICDNRVFSEEQQSPIKIQNSLSENEFVYGWDC